MICSSNFLPFSYSDDRFTTENHSWRGFGFENINRIP
jgi:hypothetical protein